MTWRGEGTWISLLRISRFLSLRFAYLFDCSYRFFSTSIWSRSNDSCERLNSYLILSYLSLFLSINMESSDSFEKRISKYYTTTSIIHSFSWKCSSIWQNGCWFLPFSDEIITWMSTEQERCFLFVVFNQTNDLYLFKWWARSLFNTFLLWIRHLSLWFLDRNSSIIANNWPKLISIIYFMIG